MLQNEYLLATVGLDTAENEPSNVKKKEAPYTAQLQCLDSSSAAQSSAARCISMGMPRESASPRDQHWTGKDQDDSLAPVEAAANADAEPVSPEISARGGCRGITGWK